MVNVMFDCLDDEEHRINVCTKYSNSNHSHDPAVNFDNIYSNDFDTYRKGLECKDRPWNHEY